MSSFKMSRFTYSHSQQTQCRGSSLPAPESLSSDYFWLLLLGSAGPPAHKTCGTQQYFNATRVILTKKKKQTSFMYEQNKGKSSDVLGSMSELDDICFFNSFFYKKL